MGVLGNRAEPLVILVMAAGLVWAAIVWKSQRRTAAMVATACALQLAIRLIWMPAARTLFGPLTPFTAPVQRFVLLSATALGQLALAASLGLLIYAALGPARNRPQEAR